MSIPFRLQLPRGLYNEMLAQAAAELPNECCGLLAGQPPPARGPEQGPPLCRVLRCYPLVNALASPTEYLSEARSMFAAVRDMVRHGLEIVAVYHSHPTSPPIPSRKDLDRNYGTEVVNFIISLQGPEPEMRGWWLAAEGYREAEWELTEKGEGPP